MILETLVIEWRDAREAILRADWSNPVVAKANVHLWTRLGHAEAALMAHARAMQPAIPPGQHEDGLIDGEVRDGVAYPTVNANKVTYPAAGGEIAHYTRPDGGFMMIDMGVNSDIAIQTGDRLEFDVGAGTVTLIRKVLQP